METKSQNSLSKRIQVASGVNVEDFECIICTDLLWKPIACNNCDSLYCSECIKIWLVQSPENCPHCQNYAERRCSPLIIKQLAKLQFACINQSNGCPEIIGYEALEKHEIGCGYKLQQCSGCHSTVLEKELSKHEDNCESIRLNCSECNVTYSRCDTSSHTENTCLREQLRQLRQNSVAYKQQQDEIINKLTAQLEQQKVDIQRHEMKIEEHSQQLNQLPNKFMKKQEFAIPGTYAKLPCKGRACASCGKCRDWYFNGNLATRKWLQGLKNREWKDWTVYDQQRWQNERIWELFKARDAKTCFSPFLGRFVDTTHVGGDGATSTNFGTTGTNTSFSFHPPPPPTTTTSIPTSIFEARGPPIFSFNGAPPPPTFGPSILSTSVSYTTTTCFCDDNVVS
ncbi:unnamed protein product [Adineta steineri]|uniref:RING-type domain-containing protein n=1 Tax=Adineta steineri TaxID=433720 RepID=A0A818V5D1_9BILA|nr:unnamed protein product [Adineta steineri]